MKQQIMSLGSPLKRTEIKAINGGGGKAPGVPHGFKCSHTNQCNNWQEGAIYCCGADSGISWGMCCYHREGCHWIPMTDHFVCGVL